MLWLRIGLHVRASVVNLVKGVLALLMLAVVGWFTAVDVTTLVPMAVLLFALSGMLGIGIGDTLYLDSLNRLGPTRALLVAMLAPPLTVTFGFLLLGEHAGWQSIVGIGLTVCGVGWVVTRRPPARPTGDGYEIVTEPGDAFSAQVPNLAERSRTSRRSITIGLMTGGLSAVMQAASLIVNRYAYAQGPADATATTMIRIAAGVVLLAMLVPMLRRRIGTVPIWRLGGRLWLWFAVATLIGTAGGMMLMQIAVDRGHNAGVIQTLLSTSPLFVMPMVALTGERVTLSAVAGGLVATAGVALLFLGS
jgi:drug/metabolite transporter (DMT)-like permease